jgi:hypothetical protein
MAKSLEEKRARGREYMQKRRLEDPESVRAINDRWRLNNPDKVRAGNNRTRAKVRAAIEEAKSVPCVDCGIQYPTHVMDLDHVRGAKEFSLACAEFQSMKRIRAEIAKCDPVCSNCHRQRTWDRTWSKQRNA